MAEDLQNNQTSANGALIELEEAYANELAAEREISLIQSDIEALRKEGLSYSHPSYFKYGILYTLAAAAYGLGFVEFTGIGVFIGMAIIFCISVISFFIFWLTNTPQKKADSYVKNMEATLAAIQSRVANLTRYSLKAARVARHVPGLRGIARRIPRTLVKIRRVARKNPITRYLVSAGLEEIPYFGAILPWEIIGVYLSYRAEKASYDNARLAAQSLAEEEEVLLETI